MKNILIGSFLMVFYFGNAQCEISFDDLNKSTDYTFSQFETFALKNGYSYKENNKNFLCDIEYINGGHLSLNRYSEEKGILVIYVFFKKSNYLDFKSILESEGKLQKINTENNFLTYNFVCYNKLIKLQTQTYNENNFYYLTIPSWKFSN